MRVEETSWSSSTPGAVEVRLAGADAVAVVGAGHANEDATVSNWPPGRSEVGERGVSPPEAGEKGGSRPGERGSASCRVVSR